MDQTLIKKIINDRKVRVAIARQSHLWFFNIYFSNYVINETAPFQKEMFNLTENELNKLAVIVAFRGSAKSTIMTMSYPIWSILGNQQKKFVLIISQTQEQARLHLKNLKNELERNKLLKTDLGPFEENDDWRSYSLVIPKYNARITAASIEQSIRGIRHGEHRPDLIICDDIEDLNSVKTRESRDKTHQWLRGDVIPAGDKNTKIVLVGNLLHEDSVLMRLKQDIDEGRLAGIYKRYPLLDENNQSLWPGKYNTVKDIEILKHTIGDEIAWQREFLLRIVPNTNRVVQSDWINYYEHLSENKNELLCVLTGIDLAIAEKDSSDYTSMVSARVYIHNNKLCIYILPNPVNERMDFAKQLEKAKFLSKSLGDGYPTRLLVEDVGYQKVFIQQLQKDGFPAESFHLEGRDKRSRLMSTTHLIQLGNVLFPKHGAEKLIEQLVGFGVEKHDDLVDAFTMIILQILKERPYEIDVKTLVFSV